MSVWVEILCHECINPYWQVTLHVSVWVEIIDFPRFLEIYSVTLHVSVWVEMPFITSYKTGVYVTLHVSVWVEIPIHSRKHWAKMSRSTWACELKLSLCACQLQSPWSRSTWACELKFPVWPLLSEYSSHAPRERVSWNKNTRKRSQRIISHAPRERVSWNALTIFRTA